MCEETHELEEEARSGRDDCSTLTLRFNDADRLRRLCGPSNEHLRLIQERLNIRIGSRGGELYLTGSVKPTMTARALLEKLYGLTKERFPLYPEDVDQAARLVVRDVEVDLRSIFLDTVTVTPKGRAIGPRGPSQKHYLDSIRAHDIVFAIGPAGTGKTYLAMAMAVASLLENKVRRIVLCRPAVEAGEKLGFLPGNLAEKVNPYLRPLYDALHDLMEDDRAHDLVERGTIEVAPLAFMRGRTLNDAFVILDEAQNSTGEQMKMFLTRLGFGAKAVVTGDVTQVDLPSGCASGLIEARRILGDVSGIAFCSFTDLDVVRHPLVQRVIRAYDQDDDRRAQKEREAARESQQLAEGGSLPSGGASSSNGDSEGSSARSGEVPSSRAGKLEQEGADPEAPG